jgi:hypothetical protein
LVWTGDAVLVGGWRRPEAADGGWCLLVPAGGD